MKQELGNETTRVTADGADYVMERVFEASPEVVWRAYTEAEHVVNWWGLEGTKTTVAELDLRPGGAWRYIHHSEGGDVPFKGKYLEVDPPRRLVRTEIYDVPPFNEDESQAAVETVTFEPVEGGTRVVSRSTFPSEEALRGALETGMTRGAIESYDRLARLVSSLAG